MGSKNWEQRVKHTVYTSVKMYIIGVMAAFGTSYSVTDEQLKDWLEQIEYDMIHYGYVSEYDVIAVCYNTEIANRFSKIRGFAPLQEEL